MVVYEKVVTQIDEVNNIVRLVRRMTIIGFRFRYMVTLTYRKEPLTNKGMKGSGIRKVIKELFDNQNVSIILAVVEQENHRLHYHLLVDKWVLLTGLKKAWTHGYIRTEAVGIHDAAMYYLFNKMHVGSDRFRLLIYNERNEYPIDIIEPNYNAEGKGLNTRANSNYIIDSKEGP